MMMMTQQERSRYEQLGIDLTYNQNFGVPMLSPMFYQNFNTWTTMRDQGWPSVSSPGRMRKPTRPARWCDGMGLGAANAFAPSVSRGPGGTTTTSRW